jgi:hypothetical protein
MAGFQPPGDTARKTWIFVFQSRSRASHNNKNSFNTPRARTFLLLLVSSIFLNVLVAWACILWSPYTRGRLPPQRADRRVRATSPGPNGVCRWWWTGQGFGVSDAVPIGAAVTEGDEFLRYWKGSGTPGFYRGGWPMLSMQSVVTNHRDAAGANLARWNLPYREILRRGFQTSLVPAWLHARGDRRLPMVPLWFGFAVNTLFYLGALSAFPFLWRRFWKQTPNKSLQPIDMRPWKSSASWNKLPASVRSMKMVLPLETFAGQSGGFVSFLGHERAG